MKALSVVLFAAILMLAPEAGQAENRQPVAVFDMAFINFSQEVDYGETNEAEHTRIRMLTAYLKELLADSGRYELVDTAGLVIRCRNLAASFPAIIVRRSSLVKRAHTVSITGAVQKLSVLVQTIVLRGRNAETGEVIWLYQTDIRGNTDIAWKRGLQWLVDHRLLAAEP